jgi:hypothetical protein
VWLLTASVERIGSSGRAKQAPPAGRQRWQLSPISILDRSWRRDCSTRLRRAPAAARSATRQVPQAAREEAAAEAADPEMDSLQERLNAVRT